MAFSFAKGGGLPIAFRFDNECNRARCLNALSLPFSGREPSFGGLGPHLRLHFSDGQHSLLCCLKVHHEANLLLDPYYGII